MSKKIDRRNEKEKRMNCLFRSSRNHFLSLMSLCKTKDELEILAHSLCCSIVDAAIKGEIEDEVIEKMTESVKNTIRNEKQRNSR